MVNLVEYCGPTGSGTYDARYRLNTGITLGGVNSHNGEKLHNLKLYENGTGMELWCLTDRVLKTRRHRVVLDKGKFLQPILIRKYCPDGSYLVWSPMSLNRNRFLVPDVDGIDSVGIYQLTRQCAREIDRIVSIDDLDTSLNLVFPGMDQLDQRHLYCKTGQSYLDMLGSEIINISMEELHPDYREMIGDENAAGHSCNIDRVLQSVDAVLEDMDYTAENLPEWDPAALLEFIPAVPARNRPIDICSEGELCSWRDLSTDVPPLAMNCRGKAQNDNNAEFEKMFQKYPEPFNSIMEPALSLPFFSLTSDREAVTYPGVPTKMGMTRLKYRVPVAHGVQVMFTKDRSEEGHPILITESLFQNLFMAVSSWMPKIDPDHQSWRIYKKTSEELVLAWRGKNGDKRIAFDLFRYAIVDDGLIRLPIKWR